MSKYNRDGSANTGVLLLAGVVAAIFIVVCMCTRQTMDVGGGDYQYAYKGEVLECLHAGPVDMCFTVGGSMPAMYIDKDTATVTEW